jgi:hypothetical protein
MDQVLGLVENLQGYAELFTFNRLSRAGEGVSMVLPPKDDMKVALEHTGRKCFLPDDFDFLEIISYLSSRNRLHLDQERHGFKRRNYNDQYNWTLIANSIIFYNAFVLSRLLEQREKMGRYEDVKLIKRISPIAWRHINLYGRFEFKMKGMSINIDEVTNSLGTESIRHQLSEEERYLD